jgi:hypothetical protein
MQIQDLPNPLPFTLRRDYTPVDITGIPAEDLIMMMVNDTTGKERRGNGKFVILYPLMGRLHYEFSEDDLMQKGEHPSYVRLDDGVSGTVTLFDLVIENGW